MIRILEYKIVEGNACMVRFTSYPIKGKATYYIFPRQIDALNWINRNLESIIFGDDVPENIKELFSESEKEEAKN